MERTPLDKHNSFRQNDQTSTSSSAHDGHSRHCSDYETNDSSGRAQIANEVDQFLDVLSAIDDKSSGLAEVPDIVPAFAKVIESEIIMYNSGEANRKFGKVAEEDSFFMESVRRISKLTDALSEFSSNTNASLLNHTSAALQRAMAFLEDEFRVLLDGNDHCDGEVSSQNLKKFLSFNSKHDQPDRSAVQRDSDPGDLDEYPPYPAETVARMHEIAKTMILAGYETECYQVYFFSRRNAIRNKMIKMEFDVILNMDEVVKMSWEQLEIEISRWINVVRTCSEIIFPGEKRLAESVFAESPLTRNNLLSNIVRIVVIQLLDFAEATAMAKRSAEKLFKYLDMYEALQNLIPAIDGESCPSEVMSEVAAAVDRIGESVVSIFCDLENSIKSDTARTPVPGGAVHPLTRYVMNYLKYACEYKDTLEKVFGKQTELAKKYILPVSDKLSAQELEKESESPHNFETMVSTTPFSIQVVTVMDLLDVNLDKKSKLYKDPSLRCLFLMNNGRYILQKAKGTPEIRQVMGDTWCRRRSTVVRLYHKNYQRETWNRVLHCLSHDGLLTNGKVNKPLLKERFKIFNTTFDEIHRTQSTWVVSDEQLQSELRISISAVVIPAYRAFVGRFRQYLDPGKQVDKYVKYQPEDIEGLIEGLFEGNTSSMSRRKT
ncbi:UNVERIFIED_CONTAM: Exocyst complex component EXO70B1 [Sesamum angustifolium]|uniref:Exocyst subunit Exo70 family protein n=1 Tax=Sesamum angustifolium TaxID=2727405 RepID=A0AAW2Q9R1_9LAMI